MGLPWVRLDVAFARNPKVLALLAERNGKPAAFAYVCGLCYSGEQGTDGWIPREALPLLHARWTDAELLVATGLWHEQPGGWVINGWDEFQQSNEETEQRRKRAQAAAQSRWAKERARRNASRMPGELR